MAIIKRAVICSLVSGVFSLTVSTNIFAEDTTADPEVLPAPSAEPAEKPEASYGPLRAGQDALHWGEQQRRAAIDRQLELQQNARHYNAWAPYVYRYALPHVQAYAPRWAARRFRRDIERAAAVGLPVPPVPPVPWVPPYAEIFGYSHRGWLQQPSGHEKIWTGPNSYIYVPRFGPRAPQSGAPTPAAPQAPTPAAPRPPEEAPAADLSAPALKPPEVAIPQPPSEPVGPGPREF